MSGPLRLSSVPITLSMGPHAHNQALLYNNLVPYQLCVHLVHKGVGISRSTTCGLRSTWLPCPRVESCQTSPPLHEFSSICPHAVWPWPAFNDCRTEAYACYSRKLPSVTNALSIQKQTNKPKLGSPSSAKVQRTLSWHIHREASVVHGTAQPTPGSSLKLFVCISLSRITERDDL